MITPEIKDRAVSVINSYINIHKDMEELELEIDSITKRKEELTQKLNKTRKDEKELLAELNESTDTPFNLIDFINSFQKT